MKFENLDHTADLKFRAFGKDLGELFENCCLAMFSAMTDVEKLEGEKTVRFKVKGEDLKSLLYELLDHMTFIRDSEHMFLKKIRVETVAKKKEGFEVEGRIYGDPVEKHFGLRYLDIKSMTYNDMEIEKKKDGRKIHWEVVFVVDI